MYQRVLVDGGELYSAIGATPSEIGIEACPGLFSRPPARDVTMPLPDADGLIDLTTFYDARGVSPQGWIRTAGWPAFYAALDRLKTYFDLSRSHSIVWELLDGTSRRGTFKCLSLEIDEGEGLTTAATWQASLRAADPRLYGGTLRSVTLDPTTAPSGGLVWPLTWPLSFQATAGVAGTVTIVNAGTVSAPAVFDFRGPWVDPWIKNESTGVTFYTRGVVLGAADHLVVDLAAAGANRVRLNGVGRLGYADLRRGDWPMLRSGDNLLRCGGSFTSGALLTAQVYDAYL